MYLLSVSQSTYFFFFFFNDTATTEIYTLSLHDALPISLFHSHSGLRWDLHQCALQREHEFRFCTANRSVHGFLIDRKSTRLNSSHGYISYAVFCLKKKNEQACSVRLNVAP